MSRDEVRAFRWVEADYVSLGDWVIYAAPNEFENPYVIDVRAADAARALAPTYERRAIEIFRSVRRPWVDGLRRRMPYVECARCRRPARWFMVNDVEWARVGSKWLKTVLCPDCYQELTGASVE
jgi:hypothetical protein